MAFDKGVSFSCPYQPPPPKKDTICHWDLGEGSGRIRSGAERKGRGCDYHEVDDDNDEDDDDGKGGGLGKVLMIVFHSISA